MRSEISAMEEVIASGDDLNEVDGQHHMTPLLWAVMRGDIDAVRLLLESGADPNKRPNPNSSPYGAQKTILG